ncbi:monovalent cation/H(+) antiporter subunit G [Rhodopseudomonas palustris]|uniref:Na+/H+ antiporter subunit n=1 Tax=Rhodopseudomonas palustris (strain DX-1) TaxID=652103 RepID=E6VNQ3_RHOPX|nr:monovalent cation/H(+) antiporter subunit G [Rhodopseudomonas palustris]QDL97095.1 monovalent cation/H(+) antiporter subunit G [Rhodopseudomonas palustris]
MSWSVDIALALDAATVALLAAGVVFFVAGTIGLLRFPDVHSRLHALTKADNLGLGFITIALLLQAPDAWKAVKMLVVWLLTMLAAATVAQLVARSALVARSPRDRQP